MQNLRGVHMTSLSVMLHQTTPVDRSRMMSLSLSTDAAIDDCEEGECRLVRMGSEHAISPVYSS